MPMIRYMARAADRLRQRGIVDTAIYSGHIARKAVASAYIDLRYLRRLARDRHAQELPGVRPTMHTDYDILNELFDLVPIGADDVLVDVGCGEGRVIAGWLSRGLRNPMFGIEINPRAATLAKSRLKRWPNVAILQGDASETVPSTATLFYLFNTLPTEPLSRLEQRARSIPQARVLIYNFLEPDISCFDSAFWQRDDFSDSTHWKQYRAVLFTRLKTYT